tara:strand:- start:261 stop:1547 length:1287 start_codon:yes stop_codon:yes gene_type:complete
MSNFPLQDAAEHLAKQGRYGDSMLVHMNPIEVDAISKMSPTGQLTTNPQTGQPEAFLPLLFSMMAPSVMGALGASAMSPLVASAIGSGLGTVAEGGSLQEGLSAGLMSGVTGGLLKGIGGGDILGGAGTEAATEAAKALPDVSTLGKLTEATGGAVPAADAGIFSKLKTGFGNIPSSMGLTQGMVPDATAGAAADAMVPSALSRGQAFMGQAVPSLASGMVGEMYVPQDMGGFEEEESPYQYEGPYKPTEQRTMTGPADPFASAFMGEQDMIGGNVFPPGFNMRYGGLIKRLERGGMPKAQQQIEESAATLDRRAQDQRILDYQQSIMAAPTVDPRSPVPPQGAGPYQAPSLREIYDSQGKLLDDVLGPNPDAPLSGNYPNYQRLKEINRNYNPLVHGIHGVSALFGKGIAEAMEAVDESRARRKGKE